MEALKIETRVQKNGSLTLDNLPLKVGDQVEVIILVRPARARSATSFEEELARMAEDPEIQRELRLIEAEFANTENDGLDNKR